ncbi:unnamed protein product [Gordionus sp. m RMFG-2023]
MNLLYNGHIPTNSLQKLILTLGSSIISILDPTRDDMVATLGETIGINAARYMQRKMHKNDEGKQILTLFTSKHIRKIIFGLLVVATLDQIFLKL